MIILHQRGLSQAQLSEAGVSNCAGVHRSERDWEPETEHSWRKSHQTLFPAKSKHVRQSHLSRPRVELTGRVTRHEARWSKVKVSWRSGLRWWEWSLGFGQNGRSRCWELRADSNPSCSTIGEASDRSQIYTAAWRGGQTYSQSHGGPSSMTNGTRSPATDAMAPTELWAQHHGVHLGWYEETQRQTRMLFSQKHEM